MVRSSGTTSSPRSLLTTGSTMRRPGPETVMRRRRTGAIGPPCRPASPTRSASTIAAAYDTLDQLYIDSSPAWARLANAAVRNMEAFGRAWEAHDWDAVMACYSSDVDLDDRRPVLRLRSDARANTESLRIAFDGGS